MEQHFNRLIVFQEASNLGGWRETPLQKVTIHAFMPIFFHQAVAEVTAQTGTPFCQQFPANEA
ncbi:hypothetical protein ACFFLE_04805 [Salinicoccus siamensis]|uniref:Uncharacterized protein n=1 Tax=Salinicoccus siamensis TaxID=381830 RepID=A0ABV5Z2U6_9STAP